MRRMKSLLLASTAGLAVAATGHAQPADDTLVVGLSADVNTFEPADISSRPNANIARHIFGTLFTIDGDGNHLPDLAESLEVTEDGTGYIYTLREGLTCHDG